MTALHKASGAGQTAVVTILLDHGAHVHAVDVVGDCSTALCVFQLALPHSYLCLPSFLIIVPN